MGNTRAKGCAQFYLVAVEYRAQIARILLDAWTDVKGISCQGWTALNFNS